MHAAPDSLRIPPPPLLFIPVRFVPCCWLLSWLQRETAKRESAEARRVKLETAAAAAAAKEAKEAARARLLRARERVLARRLKEREDRHRELAEDKARSEEKAAQARVAAQVRLVLSFVARSWACVFRVCAPVQEPLFVHTRACFVWTCACMCWCTISEPT